MQETNNIKDMKKTNFSSIYGTMHNKDNDEEFESDFEFVDYINSIIFGDEKE